MSPQKLTSEPYYEPTTTNLLKFFLELDAKFPNFTPKQNTKIKGKISK
jgi:hypothetical protein